jgi:hypothetical protein
MKSNIFQLILAFSAFAAAAPVAATDPDTDIIVGTLPASGLKAREPLIWKDVRYTDYDGGVPQRKRSANLETRDPAEWRDVRYDQSAYDGGAPPGKRSADLEARDPLMATYPNYWDYDAGAKDPRRKKREAEAAPVAKPPPEIDYFDPNYGPDVSFKRAVEVEA